MTANNYEVEVYADYEVAIQTTPKQLEANKGIVYLTAVELRQMLALMEAKATDHATVTDADVEAMEVPPLETFDKDLVEDPAVEQLTELEDCSRCAGYGVLLEKEDVYFPPPTCPKCKGRGKC